MPVIVHLVTSRDVRRQIRYQAVTASPKVFRQDQLC
jgi:hypothetical protein